LTSANDNHNLTSSRVVYFPRNPSCTNGLITTSGECCATIVRLWTPGLGRKLLISMVSRCFDTACVYLRLNYLFGALLMNQSGQEWKNAYMVHGPSNT